MIVLSLLPVGLLQTWASVEHGMWYARSADFLQSPLMTKLRWLRVIGDTVFTFGIVGLGWFVLGLKTGWSLEGKQVEIVDVEVPETLPAN
jgi:nitric oxide reductase subunit B